MDIDKSYLQQKSDFYKNQLLNDTIPFWFPKSIDEEFGGYLLMRDRDGNLFKEPFHLPRQEWYCWKLLEGSH